MTDPVCDRCGRCLSVCPVYDATRVETLSPRGRMALLRGIEAGEFAPSPRIDQSLSTCLQCRACARTCPKGVDAAARVRAARVPAGSGRTLERALLAVVTRRRSLLSGCCRIAAAVSRLFPRRGDSPARHLPLFLPEALAGRTLPAISRRSAFDRLPERIPAARGVPYQGSVTLFTGCFFGLASTGPVLSAVRMLTGGGLEVRIPQRQSCCGAPALLSDHPDPAYASMKRCLALLGGNDPVLTLCATCTHMLSSAADTVFKDRPEERAAKRLAGRVREATAFLADLDLPWAFRTPKPLTVTVHDPCHLTGDAGHAPAVRRLLSAVPGVRLKEMTGPDACCGGGGLSGLKHPAISGAIGEAKADAVLDTGASYVVAACPGCLLQIGDRLSRRNAGVRAAHPLEITADRLRQEWNEPRRYPQARRIISAYTRQARIR